MRCPRLACFIATGLFASLPLITLSAQDHGSGAQWQPDLRWRLVGPFRGGRTRAATGVPGQPNVFYFGSVGGGVWKSTNAGRTWQPIFDSQPVASIGAVAVAFSNPNVVYVGTGESDMRSQISYGNGMYKSTDAGKTWRHIGLDNTRQIARVLVDPRDPNLVYVAALGHAYGPNPDRGVFRSKDGGATWQKVLFKSNDVGAVDLQIDPSNARTIYASLWATRRPPWSVYPAANAPGGGIFKSTDGGDTWKAIDAGIPVDGRGRIGLAISAARPARIYAIVDAKEGGLFRSDDGGATWAKTSGDARVWGRGWYFGKIVADPKNADLVYISNTGVYRSRDGGKTFGEPFKGSPGGDDYHQLWISPDDSNRMILGGDQGAVVSVDGLQDHPTWSSWLNQPTAQLYHIAADRGVPYWVTAAQQDSGAVRVRTRGRFATITMRDWEPLCAGGESGYTAPDPNDPAIVFGGTVQRCNVETGKVDNISPEVNLPSPARHTWTNPLVFSPADNHALYFGDQYVFKTTDGGAHWTRISDDLTRTEPGAPQNLDPVTAMDIDPQRGPRGVVYAIAPSPLRAPLVWIGTDDGLIKVTQDDGKSWQDVTPKEMTAWSKVAMIEASHFDANAAYAAVDRHRLEDNEPHLYRTRDGGKSWQTIARGLPAGVYMQTIKEDPVRRGMLYAGNELGIFISFDDGDTWQSLQLNLPPVSVRDVAVHGDDLIAATYGRGFWVLDDISALRQLNADVGAADAFLFKPADATLFPQPSDNGTPTQKDEAEAENPPSGAILDYYLKSASNTPVTIEILDANQQVVRRYSSADPVRPPDPNTLAVNAVWQQPQQPPSAAAGMHRFIWDLRPTPPAGGRGGRGGGGGGRGGPPMVGAATYTVRLTANGKTLTQTINVVRDPREK